GRSRGSRPASMSAAVRAARRAAKDFGSGLLATRRRLIQTSWPLASDCIAGAARVLLAIAGDLATTSGSAPGNLVMEMPAVGFEASGSEQPLEAIVLPPPRAARPGPGLLAAICWVLLMIMAQVVVGIVAAVGAVVIGLPMDQLFAVLLPVGTATN